LPVGALTSTVPFQMRLVLKEKALHQLRHGLQHRHQQP
jgi:hypothetical protein